MELGAIGWFTSILSDIHKEMFGKPIRWNYEVSRFEATRERRPLPLGWCNVWNANPEMLLKREYDKVICLQKSLNDAIYSMATYHHPENTFDELMRESPEFFLPIKEKWQKLEVYKNFHDERFLFVHVDNLNMFPKEYWNRVLDFLGFPDEKRPTNKKLFAITLKNWSAECTGTTDNMFEHLAECLINYMNQIRPKQLPIKTYRNWECYSNISRKPKDQFQGVLPKIKELYLQDLNLKMKELLEKNAV